MSTSLTQTQLNWKKICEQEISVLKPLLEKRGYTLDDDQPHIKGERFLMHAVTTHSGNKLILLGTDTDGKKVVIKASNDPEGISELTHEQICRDTLQELTFAANVFHAPKTREYILEQGYLIAIHYFIEQSMPFLERPLAEQFMFALRAFKAQEGAHATTYGHRRQIRDAYGIKSADTYLSTFNTFNEKLENAVPERIDLAELLSKAESVLSANERTIEQYCGFLTHTDFVPHNFRIQNDTIYLLDHSSLTFGNKHEGWARFLNFMLLYNRPLEKALVKYIQNNRAPEELLSLWLMRIYRLGEIIWYYVNTLHKSEGDLLALNRARVDFWADVLRYTLAREEIPAEIIAAYETKRDSLRSQEEKERQKGLH